MTSPEYISKSEIQPEQWRQAGSLIAKAIPNTILSKLGVVFNALYYRSLAENEQSCACLAHDPSGKVLGIIIGTLDRPRVCAAAMKRNRIRLMLAAHVRLVRPAVILWVLKGVLSRISSRKQTDPFPRPAAELIVIALEPEARGTGIAAELVAKMEKWMKEKGLEGPYTILTEKSNGPANRFYAKMGSRFVGTTRHHGRQINEWHKDLPQE